MCLFAQDNFVKGWRPLAKLVKACGPFAISGVKKFEDRGIVLGLKTFTGVTGIYDPDKLRQVATYMGESKATQAGIVKMLKQMREEWLWDLHIMHPDNNLVDESRSMPFAPYLVVRDSPTLMPDNDRSHPFSHLWNRWSARRPGSLVW